MLIFKNDSHPGLNFKDLLEGYYYFNVPLVTCYNIYYRAGGNCKTYCPQNLHTLQYNSVCWYDYCCVSWKQCYLVIMYNCCISIDICKIIILITITNLYRDNRFIIFHELSLQCRVIHVIKNVLKYVHKDCDPAMFTLQSSQMADYQNPN